MKQEEKDVFIEKYGARAIEIIDRWEGGDQGVTLKEVTDPKEGDEVYAPSHGYLRAGIVVGKGRTRATVMLTTTGAVNGAALRRRPVHFTFATVAIASLRVK